MEILVDQLSKAGRMPTLPDKWLVSKSVKVNLWLIVHILNCYKDYKQSV